MISCRNLNSNLTVLEQAQQFLELGFSILPLTGKKPAHMMRWSIYRQFKPTSQQVDIWFTDEIVTGYGIVCGKISENLLIIDFDDESRYANFIAQFPALAETFTVKTRRGFHVYLQTEKPFRSKSFAGVDLKGEGGYVVGVGSIVGDHYYTIHQEHSIQRISEALIDEVEAFLMPPKNHVPSSEAENSSEDKSLAEKYKRLAPRIGRNNALFRCALDAKRIGQTCEETVLQLADYHSQTEAFWKHTPETHKQRYQEAIRTITSAYKAVAKTHKNSKVEGFLPNNIRERLLQTTHSTIPGRLIEALYSEGFQPDQAISWKDIVDCGTLYTISKTSIEKYLHDKKLFPPVGEGVEKNCKSDINRGRPQSKRFTVPSIEYLCELLEVEVQSTDPIEAEALRSAKTYRMALHKALIKRLQPEYSAKWHAKRLGVSKRTIQQYNQDMGVVRTSVIRYQTVNWQNVDQDAIYGKMNQSGITPGQWLQSKDGKRYPAKKGIALRLLKQRETVICCHQLPSRYEIPSSKSTGGRGIIWRCVDELPTNENAQASHKPVVPAKFDVPKQQPIQIQKKYHLSDAVYKKAMKYLNVVPHDAPPNDLTQIRGIGIRRARHLNALGIRTFYQLAHVPAEVLYRVGEFGPYVHLHTVAQWINYAHIDTYGVALYDARGKLLYDDPYELGNLREDWYWQKHDEVYEYYHHAVDRLLYIANQTESWRVRWCFDDPDNPMWWVDELKLICDEFKRRSIRYRVAEMESCNAPNVITLSSL